MMVSPDLVEYLSISNIDKFAFIIGDHETDVQCVRAANRVLQKENINVKIYSIGACYDSATDISTWNVRPDFEAREVEDVLEIVEKIKSFKLNQPFNQSTSHLHDYKQ